MTLLQEETVDKCVVISHFENFFFISDFFHDILHNYIYLMFSFSFGVWTVEKENNVTSEK